MQQQQQAALLAAAQGAYITTPMGTMQATQLPYNTYTAMHSGIAGTMTPTTHGTYNH